MNWLKQWLNFANRQVRKFSFFDVKSIQLCGACLGIALVKLVPQILQVSLWLLLVLALVCAVKPSYVFFLRRNGQQAA